MGRPKRGASQALQFLRGVLVTPGQDSGVTDAQCFRYCGQRLTAIRFEQRNGAFEDFDGEFPLRQKGL
jgi:hypothetical protein